MQFEARDHRQRYCSPDHYKQANLVYMRRYNQRKRVDRVVGVRGIAVPKTHALYSEAVSMLATAKAFIEAHDAFIKFRTPIVQEVKVKRAYKKSSIRYGKHLSQEENTEALQILNTITNGPAPKTRFELANELDIHPTVLYRKTSGKNQNFFSRRLFDRLKAYINKPVEPSQPSQP